MARYDKDIDLNSPTSARHIDKPKGEMSVREAAAMEMPNQNMETGMPGTMVHGFGGGQAHPMQQRSAGESVTEIVDHIFQLPFHAQLGILRMIAPRILGAMDARDQAGFLHDLGMELDNHDMRPPSEQHIEGT